MARGKSGRVVLEVDPELKRQLYATLEHRQLTMKDWFVMEAQSYIRSETQLSLFEEHPIAPAWKPAGGELSAPEE